MVSSGTLAHRGKSSPTSAVRKLLVYRVGGWAWGLFRLLLLSGLSFVIFHPILVKLSSSLMSLTDMMDPTVGWIPKGLRLINYKAAWISTQYPTAFLNTLALTTVLSILQLASCTLVAYGLARFRCKGRGLIFGLVIFTLVVPPQVTMVPQYLYFRFFNLLGLLKDPGINLVGSYWPLVMSAITATGFKNGLFIFILRQSFRGMSDSLEEAAYVDGASHFQTFYRIMLPSATPVMVVVFLFSFVWQWNDVFYTSLYMRNQQYLSMALLDLPSRYKFLYQQWYGSPDPSAQSTSLAMNAAMMLFIVPLLILYVAMQRYFVESIERSGIVG